MVGVEENDGVFFEAVGFELVEGFADHAIHGFDVVVELGPVATDFGGIGVVGGYAEFGGVVFNGRFAGPVLALMSDDKIEH